MIQRLMFRALATRLSLLFVSVAVIAVVASASVILMQRYVEHREERRAAFLKLSAQTYAVSAIEWRAAAEGRLEPDEVADYESVNREMTDTMAELGHEPHVASALAAYSSAVSEELALIDAGSVDEARRVDSDRVDPAFSALTDLLATEEAAHTAEVARAELIQQAGGIATIVVMMAAFGFVVWRLRKADISIMEQQATAASEARFRALVQNSSDMITVVDEDGVVRYQSPASERVLGLRPEEVAGVQSMDMVHPDDRDQVRLFFGDVVSHDDRPAMVEARIRHADGSWRHAEVVASNRLADEQVAGFVLNVRDISDRHDLEEQLRHQAFHDPLTGLANRARFMDRLEHELARSTRRGRTAAVLFLDLDDFKSVNDALGHPAGDALLVDVAARLADSVRPGDTIARFGGDEFVVLVEEVSGSEEAMEIADRLIEALRPPFALEAKEVFVRASVGVALSRRGLPRADELLRRADVAMYAAKARGKGRCEAYDPEMQASALERLTLTGDLQRAVEREEFVLRYQPLVELATGRIAGVEALIRWQHPLRGLLPPDDFIRLAEDTGLIIPIGRWVLNEACAQARRWQEAFPSEPPLTMAVNISAHQIHGPGLNQAVWEALRAAGLDASALILEITESVMMQHTEDAIERLRDLKQLGVRLAVDDFGTGYSSLSYLQRFPIDVLKIDKSFVDGIGSEEKEAELAQAIVDMARALHMEIVAEGIERVEQLERLRQLRCDLGQGYYFAHPVDVTAIDELLAAGRPEAWLPAAQAA